MGKHFTDEQHFEGILAAVEGAILQMQVALADGVAVEHILSLQRRVLTNLQKMSEEQQRGGAVEGR